MARQQNTTTMKAMYGKSEDRYLDLIRRFPLRPLQSDADLDAAIAMVDELIDRESLSAPEQDYLDVLGDLVEAYETKTIPMTPVGDAEMLRFLIDHRPTTQVQVARETKIAESTISDVLAGRRKLTRGQITKLAKFFHVEPGVFLASPG